MTSRAMEDLRNSHTYSDFKNRLVQSKCQNCKLGLLRHSIVVDRGCPEAPVVIVGEAPGETEDLEGKAFVGRAGRLLDSLMNEVGFETNKDSLIVNVIKCRPPGNRKPQSDEVASCRPYFDKQIQLVRPKIILLLGATALNLVLPSLAVRVAMKDVVGKVFTHAQYPNTKIMVLYHPAYLLRDPRKKDDMRGHLLAFKAIWTGCVKENQEPISP